jgi:uncharacterized protein (UPF0264 family)
MTQMLASVENLAEALLVLEAGADIIDLKAPSLGALGAVPIERARAIAAHIQGRKPVSATIGDLPMNPAPVLQAVQAMAATGVDYVKIGFFPGGDWAGTLNALAQAASGGTRLVAVLFGDHAPELAIIPRLAQAGFAGVMLDTQDKTQGPLTAHLGLAFLQEFIAAAKANGLLCGFAGSLRLADIPPLLRLHPDYLGFRGALCRQHERAAPLDAQAARALRACMASLGLQEA